MSAQEVLIMFVVVLVALDVVINLAWGTAQVVQDSLG